MENARSAAESSRPRAEALSASPPAPWLELVAEKVRTLGYGVVQITVHDSQVVQVERTERHRFEVPRRS